MKIKLWIYQNCSFEKGALTLSSCNSDAHELLDVVLHSETEVEIEAEAA